MSENLKKQLFVAIALLVFGFATVAHYETRFNHFQANLEGIEKQLERINLQRTMYALEVKEIFYCPYWVYTWYETEHSIRDYAVMDSMAFMEARKNPGYLIYAEGLRGAPDTFSLKIVTVIR